MRVDSGVQSGDAITIHYDPLIAKIIVHDRTRAEAIRRMDAALRETVILGTTTNLGFLRALINHPAFAAGEVDTGFIERHLDELLPPDAAAGRGAAHRCGALIAPALADQSPRRSRALPADPWSRADSFRLGQER